MESDSVRYINLILKRWWLVLLAAVIAGGIAYYFRVNATPEYTAEARLFIGNIFDPQNQSSSALPGYSHNPVHWIMRINWP